MGASYHVSLTPEAIRRIRARFDRGAATSPGFYKLFPQVREALDALPDVAPVYRCNAILRDIFRDALRDEGVELPEHFGDLQRATRGRG